MLILIAVIAVVIVGIVIYASTKPDQFHVERSIQIQAPAEQIFPWLDDFRRWDAWTPYAKDPAMKKTYSGSTHGPGAHYAWEGNKSVGKGEISIASTLPPNKLVFDLHMIKPFEGRNVASFLLASGAGGTQVTWSLDDRHRLMHKIMSLFLDLDRMIGRDFEAGLAKLKTVVENN